MKRSIFNVPKMDCPSEENLVRMSLKSVEGIEDLKFDLGARTLAAVHEGDVSRILAALEPRKNSKILIPR